MRHMHSFRDWTVKKLTREYRYRRRTQIGPLGHRFTTTVEAEARVNPALPATVVVEFVSAHGKKATVFLQFWHTCEITRKNFETAPEVGQRMMYLFLPGPMDCQLLCLRQRQHIHLRLPADGGFPDPAGARLTRFLQTMSTKCCVEQQEEIV